MTDATGAPALLVLAAGLGTRFGGDKQTTPLGPGGATLMEYTIYDAIHAGFGRIMVVVRAEMREAMQARLEGWLRGRVPAACVVQERDAARARPWGTAHAVLAAQHAVRIPFAVVNADDIYGDAPFTALAAFLREPRLAEAAPPTYALVGFPMAGTLSDAGAVNRAIIVQDERHRLTHIDERGGLTRAIVADERMLEVPVSMNLWGFTPAIFPQLQAEFDRFRRERAADDAAEFLLPTAIRSLVSAGRAQVRVLEAAGQWCGVTHPEDASRVTAELAARVERGRYPRDLWA